MAPIEDELQALRAQLAALTMRIYRLEQKTGIEPVTPAGAPVSPQPVQQPAQDRRQLEMARARHAPPQFRTLPTFATVPSAEARSLESTIGKLWLNRIGIVAILIGVAYFLKYAFDNQWIGETGRVVIGILAGIAVIVWSERFRAHGQAPFSYSLKAIGIGTLYLSLWGAFQLYHLVPSSVAFAAMIVVTTFTIVMALTENAEILAAFALIGGFSTPLLVSSGENHEFVLFSYVALLDLAILIMVTAKPWRRLLVGSFIGTVVLYAGWFVSYYNQQQRLPTVIYLLLFGAIFAAIPLLTPLTRSRWHPGFSITLTILPLVNAAFVFLGLWLMYDNETVKLTWYALALGAAYLVLSSQLKRRVSSEPEVVKLINLMHLGIAIAFITVAIPLKLEQHWITIGWLVESAVLLFVGVRTRTEFLRYLAVAALILGIFRLLIFDNFHVTQLVLNARFATYLVAIAILGGIVAAGVRSASEGEMPFVRLAAIALNLLALVALTLEADGYFSRELTAWHQAHPTVSYRPFDQIEFARNLSYSVIWLAYGAGLMLFGFWRRSAFVRWQAMALIAFTIGKVFLFDVSGLQQGYRILSFIALGVVLMGISYIYHRDWLKLSGSSGSSPQERSAST
ncbi:MAG TPA: DUF2339 domain-containing protein [Candidatus Angelobacter sp.]|nr:DUF2339 domain-containing protein [Candidatus Angelobacter sp.]